MKADNCVCAVCEVASQRFQSIPPKDGSAHADVTEGWQKIAIDEKDCGQLSLSSRGFRYTYGVVCLHSKWRAVLLYKKRLEFTKEFKLLLNRMKSKTGRFPTAVRFDGAKEFGSGATRKLLATKGIDAEFSLPYRSAQNGSAERNLDMIFAKARALRLQGSLHRSYWCYAVEHAVAVLNVLPLSIPGRAITPHEILFGEQPDVSGFRLFGCLCFNRTPKVKLGHIHLDARGEEGIHLGFCGSREGYKGYEVHITSANKGAGGVIATDSVTFDETTTPAAPVGRQLIPRLGDAPGTDVLRKSIGGRMEESEDEDEPLDTVLERQTDITGQHHPEEYVPELLDDRAGIRSSTTRRLSLSLRRPRHRRSRLQTASAPRRQLLGTNNLGRRVYR